MTRVVFKHEDTNDHGEPIGPVSIFPDQEPGDDESIGQPYRKLCTCDGPHLSEITPNGGPCLTCGEWYQPYYRLSQAEEMAVHHGVELEEQ